jgi:hypothetical protein
VGIARHHTPLGPNARLTDDDAGVLEGLPIRDSASYRDMLTERLCHRLAIEPKLTERWPEVLSLLSSRLGPSAAELADIIKKTQLKEFQGAVPSRQELLVNADAFGGNLALYYAKARFDVMLAKERGEFRRAMELALQAGRSRNYQGPADDDAVVQDVVSALIRDNEADWLVILILSGGSESFHAQSLFSYELPPLRRDDDLHRTRTGRLRQASSGNQFAGDGKTFQRRSNEAAYHRFRTA